MPRSISGHMLATSSPSILLGSENERGKRRRETRTMNRNTLVGELFIILAEEGFSREQVHESVLTLRV